MNKDELIKKVMISNEFTADEKLEIIKGLTSTKEKEYVYVPYERVTSPSVPQSPVYPYPYTPIYCETTCTTSNTTSNSCKGHCGKHRR